MFWDIISDLAFHKLTYLVNNVSPMNTCSSHIAVGNTPCILGVIMAVQFMLTAVNKSPIKNKQLGYWKTQ